MRRRTVLAAMASQAGLLACARPMAPPAPVEAPRLEADAVVMEDGARLPLSVWEARPPDDALTDGLNVSSSGTSAAAGPAVTGAPWAVILGLHGMDDYAQAFQIAGPVWGARGVQTYAYDQRGFGRGTERGRWPRAGLFARDLKAVCALLRARHPGLPLAVVGESMGGAVAIEAFAGPSPADADRLVLLSPAVWGWSQQPLANRLALVVAAEVEPGATLTPPAWVYRRHPASDNLAILRKMGRDPNMIFKTRVDATLGLVNLMESAYQRIAEVRGPVLYAYGAHDTIIPLHAAAAAAARLPRGAVTALYPEGWHLLDRDLHAETVLLDVLSFIRNPRAPLPSGAGPIPPPRGGGPSPEIAARAAAASG